VKWARWRRRLRKTKLSSGGYSQRKQEWELERRNFFLYVPEGKEIETEKLLEENQISYVGLRTWAVRHGSLIVTSIRTPNNPKDHRGSE